MKILQTSIAFELTAKEASALKTVLGKIKDSDKLNWGLDQEDIEFLSELYDLLPYRNLQI